MFNVPQILRNNDFNDINDVYLRQFGLERFKFSDNYDAYDIDEHTPKTSDAYYDSLIDMYCIKQHIKNKRIITSNIQLNTSLYGGRIDHCYLSKGFSKKVVSVSKIYSDASDHSPMLYDLYNNYI